MKKLSIAFMITFCISLIMFMGCDLFPKQEDYLNKTEFINYGQVYYNSFKLKKSATISVDISTTSPGVKIYLVDDDNLELLLAKKQFIYNTSLSSNFYVTKFEEHAKLDSGKENT